MSSKGKMKKLRGITAEEFAKKVGGRVVPHNEKIADRMILGKGTKKAPERIPKFANDEDRKSFYTRYIAGLYFVEIVGVKPGDVTSEMLDTFWDIFEFGLASIYTEGKEENVDG